MDTTCRRNLGNVRYYEYLYEGREENVWPRRTNREVEAVFREPIIAQTVI